MAEKNGIPREVAIEAWRNSALASPATPVRWIETQTPQPPNQHGFRFPADWAYLAEKLEAEDS